MSDDADNNEEDIDAEADYLCEMGLFEIEQAFLDAVFDDDGNEIEPE